MRDREPKLYQPPEIPAADPLVGYRKRVDRAVDELVAALKDANAGGVPMAEFRDRLRTLSGLA